MICEQEDVKCDNKVWKMMSLGDIPMNSTANIFVNCWIIDHKLEQCTSIVIKKQKRKASFIFLKDPFISNLFLFTTVIESLSNLWLD